MKKPKRKWRETVIRLTGVEVTILAGPGDKWTAVIDGKRLLSARRLTGKRC